MADLFSLTATLGLDTTEFTSGLDGAVGALSGFTGPGGIAAKFVTGALSKGFNALTNGVVDFAKDVIETGMETDKSFSAVQAVLGTTEGTIENMTRIMNQGQKVAKDSIFTLSEVGDAYYYMGMAGWKADQMIAGVSGVINLAAASGEDLAKTSDIVTDSLTAFGLGAGQAAHFADVLAVTATNSNTDVKRMGQTFKYLAPVAGALGYSVEDVAMSIGLIANAGIKGSMAGTSLRNIFTRLATNSGETKEKLGALSLLTDELGVSFYDTAGKARPWIEVLTEARESWKGLDPKKADKIAKAFGNVAIEGQDAGEIMNDFSNDLDAWTTEWNSLTSDAQRQAFVKTYGEQFKALGVSMTDSNGKFREFNDIAAETRIKLGGLTDEEKLFYAQQIGNLRGMTSWLALMNASEEDFDQMKKSIAGAKGAAEDMANVRLDNLWGDVQMFNSRLDILKYAIFDDIKGPMRDVVQYATGALERITDAISSKGLLGGIDQFAVEIKDIGAKLAPIMTSIGEAITPMIKSVFENLLPDITAAGTALASGFISGLGQGLMGGGGVLSGFLGAAMNLAGDVGQLGSGLIGLFTPSKEPVKIPGQVEITPEILQFAIDEASRQGTNEIVINDLAMPVSAYQNMLDELQQESMVGLSRGMAYGGQAGSKEVVSLFEPAANTIGTDISKSLSDAGNDGATDVAKDLTSKVKGTSREIISGLGGSLASAGTTGGTKMANNVSSAVIRKGDSMKSSLASKLGQAGSSAGSTIANAIQSAINAARFTANVIASVSSFFSGGTEKHAKSMYNGTILRGATVFGVNAKGQPLIGGESGPEAVIGVNSLNRTIANAVSAGMRGYAAANNAAPAPQQPMYLVLNGKVVGRVLASDNANAAAEYNRSIAVGYGG